MCLIVKKWVADQIELEFDVQGNCEQYKVVSASRGSFFIWSHLNPLHYRPASEVYAGYCPETRRADNDLISHGIHTFAKLSDAVAFMKEVPASGARLIRVICNRSDLLASGIWNIPNPRLQGIQNHCWQKVYVPLECDVELCPLALKH